MVGGTRIVALGAGQQDDAAPQPALLNDEAAGAPEPAVEAYPEEAAVPRDFGRAALVIGLVAIAGWSIFYFWAEAVRLAAAPSPSVWARAIAEWATPVLLVCVIWLLAMRASRREASRFGNVARLLSDESERLETRLLTVNRELSLAREFIAAQSRDLEALGRIAVDRVSQNADRLQSLIVENSGRVDALGAVSAAALDNMEKLRGQLPVIASSAKDVTNNIGNAGRSALTQVEQMVEAFNRLNTFGQASEQQVNALGARVQDIITEFSQQCEQIDSHASARFAALAEQGTEFRTRLDSHEVEALAAIRTRAATMAEELETARQQLDDHESQSLTSLRARVSALRDEGAAVSRALRDGEARALDGWRESVARMEESEAEALDRLAGLKDRAIDGARLRLDTILEDVERFEIALGERSARLAEELDRQREAAVQQDAAALARLDDLLSRFDADVAARDAAHRERAFEIAAQGEAILATLADFGQRMEDIAGQSARHEHVLTQSLRQMADQLDGSRATLAATGEDVDRLTEGSVRLLELIRASSEHSRDDLPAALAAGESKLSETESRVSALRDAMTAAVDQGERLGGLADASGQALAQINRDIATIGGGFSDLHVAQSNTLSDLRDSLSALQEQSETLATHARATLSDSLTALEEAVRRVIDDLDQNSAAAVASLAQHLGAESSAAIDRAMRNSAAEISGQLEQAAAHAAGVSREAAIQLRDQLAKVNELAGNLERRVAHARERAEEQVDNDFSRRAALITESLNSNAIDIARALSTEVSDTAWAAYLRGDRGIFTRRAVSLLDGAEARTIAQVYDNDRDFREHVSRYIHDFEAILRQVLSTRDGQSLGVTLLSSDMGKLYVSLAQAIERLRT